MRTLFIGAVAALAAAAPATAANLNLIVNGSFEDGSLGADGFTGWTKSNVPVGAGAEPASVIAYNSPATYPTGAFGEAVTPDDTASASPDAAGGQAAYFVNNTSANEGIAQLTLLQIGNYRLGYSYYLPQNGLNNAGDASLAVTIIGVPVAFTAITSTSPGRTWMYADGVAQITQAGYYNTSFVFNSTYYPAKDVVIDRVFAYATTDRATVLIPPTPTAAVPEPAAWALLIAGFAMTGASMRRRNRNMVTC